MALVCKRSRFEYEVVESKSKRSRALTHVCDDIKQPSLDERKRGPVSIFPQNRPDVSSKKHRLRLSHSVIRHSSIKEKFAFYMPYGCQYNETRQLVTFFNEERDFLGTIDRFTCNVFKDAKTMILYDKTNHPTENIDEMSSYIALLLKFKHYINLVPNVEKMDGGYTIKENFTYEKARFYKNLIFGSFNPAPRIDCGIY